MESWFSVSGFKLSKIYLTVLFVGFILGPRQVRSETTSLDNLFPYLRYFSKSETLGGFAKTVQGKYPLYKKMFSEIGR